MVAIFSASGFFVHTPCGPRKSGMPESVEIPAPVRTTMRRARSEEHTSELQSLAYLVCRLLLEKKKDGGGPPALREDPAGGGALGERGVKAPSRPRPRGESRNRRDYRRRGRSGETGRGRRTGGR